MVLRASQIYRLRVMGREIPPMILDARLSLKWPRWYPPTADDRQKDAQTLSTLASAGQISRETAVKSIADTYDIEDVPAELARISADRKHERKQLMSEHEHASGRRTIRSPTPRPRGSARASVGRDRSRRPKRVWFARS